MKYKPKTKSYPHQSRASLRAVRQGNHAFLMDPGTGKSKAALDAIAVQHLRKRCYTVVILTPVSGIEVWKHEIRTHLPREITRGIKWTILNHEKISQRKRLGGDRTYFYPYIEAIKAKRPDIIVVDESHRYKRAGANRSQGLWRAIASLRNEVVDYDGSGRPYVYLLTGTPNPKGYIDLFAQFRLMDPTIFGTSKAHFEDTYCQYGFGKRRYTIVRYRHTDIIKRKIREHSSIVSDSVLGLPERIWQNVPVPLPPKARQMYEKMANDFILELQKGDPVVATTPAVVRQRLVQITGGYTTDGRKIHTEKLRYLRDLAGDLLEQGKHLIVYCRFLSETAAVTAEMERIGYLVGNIQGSTPQRVRTDLIEEFQTPTGGPKCLVFQVNTGSLAITLTAGHEVIFYSLPDAWDVYFQATKRTHRIGQSHSVRYRHLICPNTVDYSILRALRGKADMHAELMGNPRGFIFGG